MVARDGSGNAQPLVSVLQGVVTPDTQPPTFLFLNFTAPVVDQNTGVFAMDMIVNTSEVSKVYYSIYRCAPHPHAVHPHLSRCAPPSQSLLPLHSLRICNAMRGTVLHVQGIIGS